MELFMYTLNGILPVFLVIFIGIFLNKLNFFSEKTKDEIIRLVFYVGTPCLIFSNVSKANFKEIFDVRFIVFTVLLIIALFFLMLALCFWIKDPSKKAAAVQIAYRSNFAIIGVPLAANLLDEQGVALAAVTLGFVVITYNISAVSLLSYYCVGGKSLKSTLLGIIKNPLIIGTALGLLFSVFNIPVFEIARKTVETIGDIASSLGLLIIGATITIKGFLKNASYILYSVFLRNVLSPILFILAGVLAGYRGDALMILAIISASPAAVNCFVMAKSMGADGNISAYGVSLTSIASMISVFFSIYIIKLLGLA